MYRVVPAALVMAMLLSIVPAATMGAAGQPPIQIQAAEWRVLKQVNQVRARHHLAPLRMAPRARDVAQDRSSSMRNQGYFGHVSPSGLTAGKMLSYRRVRYSYWGEAIGWTVYFPLGQGADWMVNWWKNSPSHRSLILSKRFNYAGVGVVRRGVKTWYTIVFTNQADHTPPVAGIRRVYSGLAVAAVGSAPRGVAVRWWGRDPRLATRTAGMGRFTVMFKREGGRWRTIYRDTRKRHVRMNLPPGRYRFVVRARDRAGNWGGWQRPLIVNVR